MPKTREYAIIRTEWQNGLAYRVYPIRGYTANGELYATVNAPSQNKVVALLKGMLDTGASRSLQAISDGDAW